MNSKYLLISLTLIGTLFFSSNNFTDDPGKNNTSDRLPYQTTTIDSKQMDANNIRTWYRTNGGFNRDPSTGNSGFEWPKGSSLFARYASGLWIGAVVGNDTLISIAEYDYEYLPGYIDNNGNPQGKDDPRYRIYKINRGDTTSYDYLHWPADQGAYVDERGKPFFIGDQTMFFSYTDGYPEAHGNYAGSTSPLKAQILQTNWCFNQPFGLLNDVIFTEYRIINRGSIPWSKCYFGLWTDDDLGYNVDDILACDTTINLGYTYNFDNDDPEYGLNPPAVGFLYVKGGIKESPGDTLKYYSPPGSNNLILKPGFKFSGMSSFNAYLGDLSTGEPSNYRETYMNFQGLRRDGTPWINPLTNQITKYAFSGDPESGTGWLYQFSGREVRSLSISGPVTVNPNDTQTVIVAQIIARGSNNKNSVTKLKQSAKTVQRFFDNNFNVSVSSPLPVTTSYAPGNGKIYLSWNDSCERVSFQNVLSGGTYRFQGYNIYQIRPNKSSADQNDTVLIKTFDIRDGIKDIRDSVYLSGYEGIIYGVVQKGSDNGISRYFVADKDTLSDREFINGTEYKFSVTAYYYDPSGGLFTLPKVNKTSIAKNIVRIIPQSLAPGIQLGYKYGDTILTDQKDLAVMPLVFRPFELINAKYTSAFGKTDSVLSWTLTRTVNGNTLALFENVKDFTGNQDTAKTVDGFLLVHQMIMDSGVVKDPGSYTSYYGIRNLEKAWTYEPSQNMWFEGPDTNAVKTTRAKTISGRQFESRSIGMSFPTLGTFRNLRSKIFANGSFFKHVSATSPILTGGPLRKIQIVFGQSSMSYRYVSLDTNFANTPYADMISIPFSVFAADELDSGGGRLRQLNTGFLDADNDGQWDPDTSEFGNYQFTYIFASDYNPVPDINYTTKNPGTNSPTTGFPSLDVMYGWLPRAKRSENGVPLTFTNGDILTVTPYRITRSEFVPGYPVKYSWTVTGTEVNTSAVNQSQTDLIKAFPNPYYGTSELEYDSGGEKFIYFSHLPQRCDIYIYTLNGSLVRKTQRNVNDPSNTLEKWDLRNSGGSMVASGMYIVYVDCKELGTKTLKIAVFTMK